MIKLSFCIVFNWALITIASAQTSVFHDRNKVELSTEEIDIIRMAAIEKHLTYLNFKNDIGYPKRLCRRLSRRFVDFDEIFNPGNLEIAEIPDSVYQLWEKPFLIWRHSSPHFQNSQRSSIPGYFDINTLEWVRSLEVYFPRSFDPTKISFYNEDSLFTYSVYGIHDQIYDFTGYIAVNDYDVRDIIFIAGSFLPLSNLSNWLPEKLSKPYTRHGNSRYDRFRETHSFPDTFKIQTLHGIIEYSVLLSSFLSPTGYGYRSGKFIEHSKGTFTVKAETYLELYHLKQAKSMRGRNRHNWNDPFILNFGRQTSGMGDSLHIMLQQNTCKTSRFAATYYYDPHTAVRKTMPEEPGVAPFNSIIVRPNIICSNYNGQVVTSVLIRINPHTGKLQFKFGDKVDLSRIPECP